MLRDSLEELVGNDSAETLLNVLIPIAILLITIIFRGIIPRIIDRILRTIPWFKDRPGAERETLLEEVEEIIVAPLKLLILAIGLWIALLFLELEPNLREQVNDFITTIGLISVFWAILRAVHEAFLLWRKMTVDEEVDTRFNETIVQFLRRIAEAIVVIFGIVIIFEQWGLDLTGLLAGLGIGGLAIALAAQETLSNLVGYFSIIADRPFDVGDYIISSEYEGIVETIGFRTTRVRRPDRAVIYIPNRILANDIVTNWSHTVAGPRRGRARVNITLGLTYDTKADQMENIVNDIRDSLKENDRIYGEPLVHFTEFGASSLDIMIVFLIRVSSWPEIQATKEKVNLGIMRIVDAHGLDIAFPTRTVILEQGAIPPQLETEAE